MDLSATEIAALEKGSQRVGIFFWLDTDPAVRIWLGIGKIKPGVNAIDTTGKAYEGKGEISYIPALTQLINGQAERVDFELSGTAAAITDKMALEATGSDAEKVKNKACAVGVGIFDSTWALIGPIRWARRYRADFLSFDEGIVEGADETTQRKIVLSVGSAGTGRWRPLLSYFTDNDQQARYPGDLFCERTTAYGGTARKTWPDF